MPTDFDGFEIDLAGLRLLRDGVEVPLERRALDMLCYLAARPGRLVRKEELIAEVWRVRALSPGVLANTTAKLRKAFGQAASDQVPIETVHGRGYRFHLALRGAPAAPVVNAGTAAVAAPSLRSNVAPAQPGPFVGRGRVMELLGSAIERVLVGQGQCVLLSGEAGIGKTRTLGELAIKARARGFSVFEGAAYDGGGAPPFWPWIEVLRAAHRELPLALWQGYLPAGCQALPRLVPELFPALAPMTDSDAQARRFQLFDELTRFVAAISADAPLLIMVDDVHWADPATVELLAHAARALAKQPVLLAVSMREGDAPASEPHAEAIGRLSRHARRISLRGFSPPEISELLGVLHGPSDSDAACAQILAERTQGNPFFIRQMLELLLQQGQKPDVVSLNTLEAPPAVRHVIKQRIASLSRESRGALAAAAVIGQEFAAPLLAELLGVSLAQALASIEPACELGVITRRAAEAQRFLFAHALLRETLYDELHLHESGALHARLAHALSARQATGDARQLGEVARHYLLAVPSELAGAVNACRRAADAAREASGFEAAAEFSARALQKLLSEGGDAYTGCELALSLGVDQYCAGNLREAWPTLAAGAARARQLPGAGGLLARFVFRMFDCAEAGEGDEAQVNALLDQALTAIGDDDADLRAGLLAHRAEIAMELPFTERLALLDQADRLARQHGATELVLEVANSRVSLRDPTQPEHSRDAVARLRALLRQHPSGAPRTRLHMLRFSADLSEYLCALRAGDLACVDELTIEARGVAQAAGLPALRILTEAMAAGRALGDGRLDELERRIAQMRELSLPLGGGLAGIWQYYLLQLADQRGTLPSVIGMTPSPAVPEGAPRVQRSVNLAVAWAAAKVGDHDRARERLAALPQRVLARMPVLHGDLGTLCDLAETYVHLEDRQGAARVRAQLLPHASANAVGPCLEYRGSVEHYLGMLAELLGDHAEAREHYARAEASNERLGMRLQVERTRQLAAKVHTHAASRRGARLV
jgi:hypothetical protein